MLVQSLAGKCPAVGDEAMVKISRYICGVDIGGTFTDSVILSEGGGAIVGKSPTTPDDLSRGFFDSILDAVRRLDIPLDDFFSRLDRIAHGTTTGLNALITDSGAEALLITTAGHADAIRIMNNRGRVQGASLQEMLDWSISSNPDPIVPAERVIEINERIDSMGEIVAALPESEIERVLDEIAVRKPQSVAICLLWSFANSTHEERLRSRLAERFPDLAVSCSFEVASRIGAYPRMATTVMNAMLAPLMSAYVQQIGRRASDAGYRGDIFFVQNEGGLVPASEAAAFPILTLKSGPVAGVVGAGLAGRQFEDPNVIVADMGGTTLDVGVIQDGAPSRSDESIVRRQQVHLRAVDVESIGAGGGSVAWIDERTNALRVGPRSAGARPGPICYGHGGTEVTVTDADLVLGILDEHRPLAGGLRLDRKAAEEGLARLGARLGLDAVRCAAGVVEVVDSLMEDLIRRTTVQRGLDPRDFSLWVYGGASGAHAGLFSRDLNVKRVVLPLGNTASVWSALGCCLLDQRREFSTSIYLPPPWDLDFLAQQVGELKARAERYAAQIGLGPEAYVIRPMASLKYGLQVHEIEVEAPAGELNAGWRTQLAQAFEAAYEKRFGAGSGSSGTDIMLTGLRAVLEATAPTTGITAAGAASPGEPSAGGRTRPVFWREFDAWRETPVWRGDELPEGRAIEGPAIVEYSHTTVVARPGQRMWRDKTGSIILDVSKR